MKNIITKVYDAMCRLNIRLLAAAVFILLGATSENLAAGTTAKGKTESWNKRMCFNFDLDWKLHIGDIEPEKIFSDKGQDETDNDKTVSLPRAFNEDEAFRVQIAELSDTVVWYYKTFRMPKGAKNSGKVFIEFEGVRQGADVWINGQHAGFHENGVMAFGIDLTKYIDMDGDNKVAVRVDNRTEVFEIPMERQEFQRQLRRYTETCETAYHRTCIPDFASVQQSWNNRCVCICFGLQH